MNAASMELHEGRCQEVVKSGHGARKDLESPCWDGSQDRPKLRRQLAAAGKQSTTSLSLFMEAYGLKLEKEHSTLATQCWAEGIWTGSSI